MSKGATAAAGKSGPNRVRRNTFMRKCLDKQAKRLYGGMGHQVFRMIKAVSSNKKA
jgi:hypothetical protein